MTDLTIIGGGLAGSEAALQVAHSGFKVQLYEMRPSIPTGAHLGSDLAELVCSNSLGSNLSDRASGVLKNELRQLNSMLLECAEATALPAGAALAVDREAFARMVTEKIENHPNIKIIRAEMKEIPQTPVIIASGPLTSESLTRSIAKLSGEEHLFFFDAIAPIVHAESINMEIAFRASRYGKGDSDEGDYINCPFTKDEYYSFVNELQKAERIELRSFEEAIRTGVKAGQFFEGCLPIEVIAERGIDSLAYGPMRPVGLRDPRTGRGSYAVVQLRQDNLAGSLYNLVGFQTNLKFPEQKRILRLIPGLENAEFERFGQMHRNTFIASPKLLRPTLQHTTRDDLFFAGQITGVEGYMGNIATGLLAGINASRLLGHKPPIKLPHETMLGALCHYITHADLKDFQPMKANFGILPPLILEKRIGKRERGQLYANRAAKVLEEYLNETPKEKVSSLVIRDR
ncbi:methylenetetrahydrofolate--tRNA-(uracil(54)-C(5))-methyltransferase (FADH(2)-oxidizing) TrmFO [Candidatus Villigracilis saccharophilus]|uniref:methylenetetrahydrofolate--tRNA-(uracil(54)- C(5))-methyltransferase (FADH(2)-oxidizing) TrmFO n=1 Tax=Candidatus Villigracilis saccharophilus TaxID=3140684 RepID=UPI0031366E94|nr:methylenetetrahydrofolate--tRNA-(uracil(54)-C(5))-methyltransferase (FADH(2)-oxidizing) TrmFO [Anaerolineales bacterium]